MAGRAVLQVQCRGKVRICKIIAATPRYALRPPMPCYRVRVAGLPSCGLFCSGGAEAISGKPA